MHEPRLLQLAYGNFGSQLALIYSSGQHRSHFHTVWHTNIIDGGFAIELDETDMNRIFPLSMNRPAILHLRFATSPALLWT